MRETIQNTQRVIRTYPEQRLREGSTERCIRLGDIHHSVNLCTGFARGESDRVMPYGVHGKACQ